MLSTSHRVSAMNVAPETGEWNHWLCQSSSNIPRIRRECEVWEEGEWAIIRNYGACINKQNPFPWIGESQLLSKSLAYYGGTGVSWARHWLSKEEKLPSNGCWTGPPRYENGIEISNVGQISVHGTGTTYPRRYREVKCPLGYQPSATAGCEPVGVNPHKNNAICPAGNNGSNPIHTALGTKLQQETDYRGTASGTLVFKRFYSSASQWETGNLGKHWRHNYSQHITLVTSDAITTATVYRQNGNRYYFTLNTAGEWQSEADINAILTQITNAEGELTSWQYIDENDTTEIYNQVGQLDSIQFRGGKTQTFEYNQNNLLERIIDQNGNQLRLDYNAAHKLSTLTDPAGFAYSYSYDAQDNLSAIHYPDNTLSDSTDNPQRVYHYEDNSFPHALTGITDENNNRYASYQYNAEGKATSSEHAGGVNKTTLNYQADGSTAVTDALGKLRNYQFQTLLGVIKNTQVTSLCTSCGGKYATTNYDAQGNVISRTDFNGNVTSYQYDLTRNLVTQRTEAVGTNQEKTVVTQWHSQFRLPIKITSPEITTEYSYDNYGNIITKTERILTNSHTWQYSYNTDGQILTVDGPRTDISDITTYSYNPVGYLALVTNPLGQETSFTAYDAHGQLLQYTDPNGLVTNLNYNPRGWLVSKETGLRKTLFTYDNVGQLIKMTLPNQAEMYYSYDAAHRLVSVKDMLANTIEYILDAQGNIIDRQTKDPDGVLVRQQQFIYDALGQLSEINDPQNHITTYSYDANGNRTTEINPNGQQSQNSYDVFNQLVQHLDPLGGETNYAYDQANYITAITNPNGHTTKYSYDGLGNLIQEVSPDRGTLTYDYDQAGNITSQTDARGITRYYQYDALNRVTSVSFPDAQENIQYIYDVCSNGIGHLCEIKDPSGISRYSYSPEGNVIAFSKEVLGITLVTSYAYDSNDKITTITYPGGMEVHYQRDQSGRIIEMAQTINGNRSPLIENIQYRADGVETEATFGNGLVRFKLYNLSGQLLNQSVSNLLDRHYQYDANGNILNIDQVANNSDYNYDSLDRLVLANRHNQHFVFSLDSNGNRIEQQIDGNLKSYTIAQDSNRMLGIASDNSTHTFSYDASGNMTDDGRNQYRYGANNRLTKVTRNGAIIAQYTYNAYGQRSKKEANGTIIYYCYDLDGNLIAETDGSGNTKIEYLYLNGELVAQTNASDGGGNMETILDNHNASFTDAWPISTNVTGYEGSDYQYHVGGSTGSGTLGTPVDNLQASFTDNWTISTSVNQYYAENYQYHAGSTAGLGTLGSPVDNLQAIYTGTWTNSTSVKQYYSGNYQFHAAGTGLNTAIWATGVTNSASYDVYVSWTAHANRASNAKYTINHSGGSDTVTVNQQQNGSQWNLLGTFTLDANSTVSLSDNANGYVIADAISIMPAGTPPTVTPQSGETATWALNVSNTSSYDVYANWTAHPNRASDAKYTVHHSNGSDTVTVNQQQNGGQWNFLGTYTLDNTSTVGLSSLANGYVIADGITVLPAGALPTVIPPQAETATWTPNQSGEYEIYANWTAHSNRATDAKYTIYHSNGNDTLAVNQQQNGGQWNLLGTFTLNSSSTIALSNDANGYVIADGIRLVSTGSTNPAQAGIFYVHNDHLGTPQVITDAQQAVVWQGSYDPFGKATITTETITNNIRFPGQYYDQETGLHYNLNRYYSPKLGRYITSDPIGLDGGLNTYAYGLNNPNKYSDPWGLWSTAAHTHLIRKFGEGHGLTEAQMQAMTRGSAHADSIVAGFQEDDFSFMHAMTSSSITSKKKACEAANQFIQGKMDEFQNPKFYKRRGGKRNRSKKYFQLGMAMHTAMDSTSPAHQGFQLWNNDQIPRHGPDSFMGVSRNHTEEGLSALLANPALMNNTIDLMNAVMDGGSLDCGCY